MAIGCAPYAAADPVSPGPVAPDPAVTAVPVPAGGPVISLADLGSNGNISFYVTQNSASASVAFPVPAGLMPVAIKARLELPVALRFGNLAVRQGDRTISRQLLPAQDQAELTIPLDGVQVFGGWVNLTFAMTALPLEDYCWDPRSPIRLADAAVSFSGTVAPPTSVADFLPPVLRKVVIAVPASPSRAESAAAVQAATAVAKRNGQQPEVVVVPLPGDAAALPGPTDPLERQIIVKEGPRKGLSLQGSALLISGPPDGLADQAKLLSGDPIRYALSTNAVSEALPEQEFEPDSTTLDQMTGGGISAEAAWPRATVPIDQTRWAHPIGDVTVHLLGSYTPVPAAFGGEVIVSVGGDALENSPSAYLGGGPSLDRWPADGAGTIDRTVTIPNRLLKRSTTLEVVVRVTGDAGHCGDYFPALLKLDGATSITLKRSDPPTPPGFQSLPQALMTPRVSIGIGADAFADTVRAAQIMVGLQRASAVPLAVDVTSVDQAVNSTGPAIVIAADGWKDKPFALPFSVDQGQVDISGVDSKGQSVKLTLDPAKGFGSLQAVYDGQRTMLVATSSGTPGQLDELLRYLAARPSRWGGLDGRAILSVPGVEPITVPNPVVDAGDNGGARDGAGETENWFWWGVGGVAVLASLGAAAILVHARRQSSSR